MRSMIGSLTAALLIGACLAAPQEKSGGDLTSLIQDVFQPNQANPDGEAQRQNVESTTQDIDGLIEGVFGSNQGNGHNNLPVPNQGGNFPVPNQGGNFPVPNQGGNFPVPNQGGNFPVPNQGGNFPVPNQGGNFPVPNQGGNFPVPNQGGNFPGGNQPTGCECVPYYQCQNGSITENGVGIIDIRFGPETGEGTTGKGGCADYLSVCCSPPNQIKPPDVIVPTSRPPSQRKGCGQRNPEGVGFRITGAKDNEAQFGEFPWMVAILKEEGVGQSGEPLNVYQCGGALIHPQIVLTAAHCVLGKSSSILKVRAGEWDTQTKNEVLPHQDRGVRNVITHENYHKGALYNDFGLLILTEPVDLTNENVGIVCLPEANEYFDHSRCFASGWGKDIFGKEGHYQVILKRIDLPVVPNDQCQNALRTTRLGKYFQLHTSFICAGGEPGKDTCKGDGGSPLVCPMKNNPQKFAQAGIVAWGIGCGENQVPGVYANVAVGRSWIDQQATYAGFNLNEYQFI